MEKTNFRDGNGKVYMTHATKAIYGLTMMDTVRIKWVALSFRPRLPLLLHLRLLLVAEVSAGYLPIAVDVTV